MARIATFGTVALACLTLAACRSKDDDDDGTSTGSPTTDTGSSWLVGEDGEMLRLGAGGEVEPYPLDEDADLHAIACVGSEVAWVVGGGGTVLSTNDAGKTWQRHDVGVTSDLRAVAVGEDHHASWTLVAVGDDGVVLEGRPDAELTRIAAPALDWAAVALDAHGDTVLLASDDGTLWRATGSDAPVQVWSADATLTGLSMTPAGDRAVVVGSEGLVAISDDGGTSWTPIAVPTFRDLRAVRLAKDGSAIVAVGDAGVVVTIDDDGATATEQLDPALALHGVHLHSTGAGHAVGDAGIVLVTPDVGRTWSPVETGTDAVLRGIDDVNLGAHW